MQTLTRTLDRATANKYHEIYISFVTFQNAAALTLDGGVQASITIPQFAPINNVGANSRTILGNGVLVGFAQIGEGCVRKFIINDQAVEQGPRFYMLAHMS